MITITWSFKNWLNENGTHIALAGTYQKFSALTPVKDIISTIRAQYV
jgi:hypothetical protein